MSEDCDELVGPLPMVNVNGDYSNAQNTTIIIPFLPSTPDYFCCCHRVHITLATKIVSVISSIIYFALVFFVILGGNSAAVLNAIIIALSVSACAIYGAFRWCKLCLIPFMMFQALVMLYSMSSLIGVIYALFQRSSYLDNMMNELLTAKQLKISSQIGLLVLVYVLMVLIVLTAYSIRIIWYEYQFIAEIDALERRMRKQTPET